MRVTQGRPDTEIDGGKTQDRRSNVEAALAGTAALGRKGKRRDMN